jgi:hypothetical protein
MDVQRIAVPESKRLRVFEVDDEPIIGFTLATILENAGYAARSFFVALASRLYEYEQVLQVDPERAPLVRGRHDPV